MWLGERVFYVARRGEVFYVARRDEVNYVARRGGILCG